LHRDASREQEPLGGRPDPQATGSGLPRPAVAVIDSNRKLAASNEIDIT
jgi:hypothetical protein